jgi:hypothetical protein
MTVITASPKSFSRLIELQEVANENLRSIRSVIESSPSTIVSSKSIEKETLDVQKEMLEQMKEDAKARAEDAADIAKLAQGVTTFKSLSERLSDGFGSFKSKFSLDNLRKSVLSATNVGGINNKRLAREDFIQQQKALGVTSSRAELKQKYEGAQSAAKSLQSNEAEFERLKKITGLNEEQLSKTAPGKALLEKRAQASSEFSKFDARAGLVATGPMAQAPMTNLQPITPSTAAQNAGEQQEAQIENARLMGDQTDLLHKIEENTRGGSPDQKASSASGGEGGGLLGGIGAGLGSLGKGLGKLLQSIGGGAGRGLALFLRGLASGVAALANPASLLGLGAFTLAMMGLGKALQMAAPAIAAFAPVLMTVAEVVGEVLMTGLKMIPDIIASIAKAITVIVDTVANAIIGVIDEVTLSIERLAAIGGEKLFAVGAGLVAVAGGLAAFGAGSAIAGVTNLVGGLLGAITPGGGPIEQITKLGENGVNIEKAGIGVEKLATGLKAFSGIDTDKIKAISALPTEKIAAMGAAMGNATAVESRSAQNSQLAMQSRNGAAGNTNVVAPTVNNVNNQTNVIKPNIRNQESSWSRYQSSRYAFNNF